MRHKAIPFILSLALLAACKENPKKETEPAAAAAESVAGEAPAMGETVSTGQFCYVSRTPTPEAYGDTYNYQFIRFEVAENGNATGTVIYAPYGTDGFRGSISGVYREGEKLLQSTTTYLAEGELYEEQRDYRIGEQGLSFLNADKEPTETIPAVSCEQFDTYMKEYQRGILAIRVNTEDRTRLKKIKEVAAMGYSAEELDKLRFMEAWVDLDNRNETEEYLVYLMDPMVCGTGGCNLYVIDGKGNTLSSTTVVKLPIYMPVPAMADVQEQGNWKPLYVWSQGFRKLESQDGRYPGNASMEPEVSEALLKGHPEKYFLVMDHLD